MSKEGNKASQQNEHDSTPTTTVRVSNRDTVGAVFLGIAALILLIAFLRSQERIRELLPRVSSDSETV